MIRHRLLVGLVGIAVVAACGGEDEDSPPPRAPGAAPVAPAPAPVAGAGSGKQLVPMLTIEDRVSCDPPTTERTCDPKLPSACEVEGQAKQYCLQTTKGWFCGPCEERETIRKRIKPRDFATEVIRDPFVSAIVQPPQADGEGAALPKDVTKRCDDKKIKLPNYSFLDLRLVGVIKLGLERKLLMMDPVNVGHVIARRECVGKERAFVKDIGEEPGVNGRGAFVVFEIPPDPTSSDTRPPEERTIYLNPNSRVTMTQPPSDATRPSDAPSTPVVAPGGRAPTDAPPAPPANRGSGEAAPPVAPPPVVAPPR